MKAVRLEAKVAKLKLKVIKAKEVSITKFRESNIYKLMLNATVTQFLTKEMLK